MLLLQLLEILLLMGVSLATAIPAGTSPLETALVKCARCHRSPLREPTIDSSDPLRSRQSILDYLGLADLESTKILESEEVKSTILGTAPTAMINRAKLDLKEMDALRALLAGPTTKTSTYRNSALANHPLVQALELLIKQDPEYSQSVFNRHAQALLETILSQEIFPDDPTLVSGMLLGSLDEDTFLQPSDIVSLLESARERLTTLGNSSLIEWVNACLTSEPIRTLKAPQSFKNLRNVTYRPLFMFDPYNGTIYYRGKTPVLLDNEGQERIPALSIVLRQSSPTGDVAHVADEDGSFSFFPTDLRGEAIDSPVQFGERFRGDMVGLPEWVCVRINRGSSPGTATFNYFGSVPPESRFFNIGPKRDADFFDPNNPVQFHTGVDPFKLITTSLNISSDDPKTIDYFWFDANSEEFELISESRGFAYFQRLNRQKKISIERLDILDPRMIGKSTTTTNSFKVFDQWVGVGLDGAYRIQRKARGWVLKDARGHLHQFVETPPSRDGDDIGRARLLPMVQFNQERR